MVRTKINTTKSGLAGTAVTYAAADAVNGMFFSNSGEEYLIVKNGGTGAITVTVKSVPCSHGRLGDAVVSVPAGADRTIGIFPRELFNQVGTTSTNVDFSSATSVTVAAMT